MAGVLRMGWPNRISVGRVLAIGPFVVCLLNLDEPGRGWLRWLAIGLFGAMAVSDMLDGYLARRLRDESPLGAFLDPLADKLLVTAAVLILCIRGVHKPAEPDGMSLLVLPNWVAVGAIGKDLVVCIGFAIIYVSTGRVFIQPRRLGKWCTTVQLAMVLAMLLWPSLPNGASRLPQIMWTIATALAALAALDYIRLGSRHLATAAAKSGGE